MAFSGSQTTRHGLYGGARAPYGSFAGKAEAAIVNVVEQLFASRGVFQPHATAGAYQPHAQRGTYQTTTTGGRIA